MSDEPEVRKAVEKYLSKPRGLLRVTVERAEGIKAMDSNGMSDSEVRGGAALCGAVSGAVWCCLVQCGAVWCSAVQCSAVQRCVVQRTGPALLSDV
jgi:hypothetical protein